MDFGTLKLMGEAVEALKKVPNSKEQSDRQEAIIVELKKRIAELEGEVRGSKEEQDMRCKVAIAYLKEERRNRK